MTDHRGDRDGYFIAGDALRAVAAIAVLLFHVYVATVQRNPAGGTLGRAGEVLLWGNTGLYVFFVLSGYLVGGPYVRAWINGTPAPEPRAYIGRRLRRIVPAFWLVLAGLITWHGVFGSSTREVLFMFGFGQNFDPGAVKRVMPQGWTLDVEMTFYLVLPLIAFVGSKVRAGGSWTPQTRASALRVALGFVLVYGLALRAGLGDGNDPSANLFTMSWAFVPGLALAAWEADLRRAFAASPALGRRSAAAALLLAALTFAWLVLVNPSLLDGFTNVAYAIVGGGVVGATMFWQWTTGRAPRLLDNTVMHHLGRWSYGIYLVHVGIGLELLKHVPSGGNWAVFVFLAAGMLAGSIVVAALLWWLVEEPFITRSAPKRPDWLPHPQTPHVPAEVADAKGVFIAGDSLRALSCLAVVVFHVAIGVALVYGRSPLDAFGIISEPIARITPVVFVFFGLSGYLVGGPFVRAWLRNDGRWPDPRRYAKRRIRRIVPAFLIVCAALVAYYGTYGSSTREVVLLFAFAQNFDPGGTSTLMPQGWTLDIEVLFYLALPLAAFVIVKAGLIPASLRTRQVLLYGGLAAATVLGIVWRTAAGDPGDPVVRNLIGLAHAFTPGLFLAAIEAQAKPALRGTLRGRQLGIGLGLLMVVAWSVVIANGHNDGELVAEVCSFLIGIGSVGGALVWQWATGRAPALLDNQVMHALGRWSYGIYLVHVGVVLTLIHHIPSGLSAFGALVYLCTATIVASTVLAALLWWLVEEPFIDGRLPRRWWQSLSRSAQEPAPVRS